MVTIKEYIKDLDLITIKFNVPQVGFEKVEYKTLLDVEDTLYDFIINENGELMIGRGHYKLNRKSHKLYFAGRLKIRNGLIYYIDNDSGHYVPQEKDLNNICKAMMKSGIIDNNFEKIIC